MKTAARILLLAAMALLCYGYWGTFTARGNKVYDEMDGYIPFGMLLLGVVLLVIAMILLLFKKKNKKMNT